MDEESQSSEWSVELNIKLQETSDPTQMPQTKHEQKITIFQDEETPE